MHGLQSKAAFNHCFYYRRGSRDRSGGGKCKDLGRGFFESFGVGRPEAEQINKKLPIDAILRVQQMRSQIGFFVGQRRTAQADDTDPAEGEAAEAEEQAAEAEEGVAAEGVAAEAEEHAVEAFGEEAAEAEEQAAEAEEQAVHRRALGRGRWVPMYRRDWNRAV